MKKLIFLSLSIITSTLSFSQSNISFGARVGVSLASMRGDAINSLSNLLTTTNGTITTTNSTGFFTGMYAVIPLDNQVAIEPAIYYSQKGYGVNGSLSLKGLDLLGTNAKAQIQSQYIDVPVLLKVRLGSFQVFAGPQISYLLHANLHASAGLLGINLLNTNINATNQFNRLDAGLSAGMGYEFANGLSLMASYDYGLSKIDVNRKINGYNNAVKIGVGIAL